MRHFVFLAACLACAASAAQAEDRFGPQPAAVAAGHANERAALIYDTGAALSWSGKTQPQSAAVSDIRTLQAAPLADGLLRNTSAAPYGRPRAPQPAAQGPAQATAMTPPATGPIAAAQPRFPQYTPVAPLGAPAPVPAPVAQVAAASPISSANGAAVLSANLFDTAAEPADPAPVAPRPRIAANATGANAPVGSRLYSVHSGYGLDPDPIPLPQTGVGQAGVGQ